MNVDIRFVSSQIIHLSVNPIVGDSFDCSFLYGATDKNERGIMLTELENTGTTVTKPWIVMWDFNCIANLNERIEQKPCLHEIEPFRRCMASCDIHVMKSTGSFFTWSNKQRGEAKVLSKIDRVLGNPAWECSFPTAEVCFLLEGNFDHTQMLVQFLESPKHAKPFKFLNHWGKHKEFMDTIRATWHTILSRRPNHLDQKLRLIKEACKAKFKNTEAGDLAKAEADLQKA
ncbi:uncharacterized protein LOC130801030 [Amaranthus tricolor]|uniref:uncharacterized protein LOC130801030 n=1 Tax=Amaranthus tricolor TaxID=29722 RepID=UPI00258BDB17|nr:uncharacterized protein LOC130801030 [Amaranthus tricolor]